MVDVVSIAGASGAVSPRVAASASPTAAGGGSAGSSSVLSGSESSVSNPLAPQVRNDPVAGLVTQFLDSGGNIINQVPSTRALTYLRAGLTADGMRREQIGNPSITA